MSDSTLELKSSPAKNFLSTENITRADSTVKEVFDMMFGLEIKVLDADLDDSGQIQSDDKTAIVGFSGSLRGSCQLRINHQAAYSIASAMLGGTPIAEGDESLNDALGELCNMLAGGWKNGIADFASGCALSPPTIVSGLDYKIHMARPSTKLCRTYQFGPHTVHLSLYKEVGAQG
ncbi:MAG TPA: chemotaxis protein CheX [Acidobacteriaceae bacterium]|nr:chemotaxis protein CheX [Acidobacteriaceae bacterium]